MTHYICRTCGTQYPASAQPPEHCPICEDERQYVGLKGQQWTTLDALRAELEPHREASARGRDCFVQAAVRAVNFDRAGPGVDHLHALAERIERGVIDGARFLTASSPMIAGAYAAKYGAQVTTIHNTFSVAPAADAAAYQG